MRLFRFISALAFAFVTPPAVLGQTTTTIHMHIVPNQAALNEVATIIRTVGNIKQINADHATDDVTVTGTTDDLAFAEWLVKQVDTDKPAPAEFAMPGADDIVHTVYLANSSQAGLNEVVTTLRVLLNIQRIFTYSSLHAMVFRTTAEQAQAAQWVVSQVDLAPDDATRWQPHQYAMPDGTVMRVMYLIHQTQPAGLNEMVSVLRTVGDIKAIFTRSLPQGIAFRATPAQAQMADWLFQQLDVQPDEQMRAQTHDYRLKGDPDEIARVFYLRSSDTNAQVNELIRAIRAEVTAPRMFTYKAAAALAVRGTSDVIDAADRIIKDQDK
jgi:hypothetical protein